MKFSLSIIFVILLSLLKVNAQDSTFKELGLNATPFVNQYLDFGSDDDNDVTSPFMITYEQRFGKLGFRAGLGFNSFKDNVKPENGVLTEPEFHVVNTTTNFRLGAVLYKDLSKRWSLKYGVDAVLRLRNDKNWTKVSNLFGEEATTTNSILDWNSGIAPFVFVQFHFSEHFSIATELVASATYGETVTKVENTEFPQFNTRQETTGLDFNILPPTALYFILRF